MIPFLDIVVEFAVLVVLAGDFFSHPPDKVEPPRYRILPQKREYTPEMGVYHPRNEKNTPNTRVYPKIIGNTLCEWECTYIDNYKEQGNMTITRTSQKCAQKNKTCTAVTAQRQPSHVGRAARLKQNAREANNGFRGWLLEPVACTREVLLSPLEEVNLLYVPRIYGSISLCTLAESKITTNI